MSEPKSVNLFYTEGSSDKVYQAQLQEDAAAGGWRVHFQYGPRGKALKAGEKTTAPLPYAQALKVYDALVKSKTAKGYTEEESGIAFAGTANAGRVSGFQPQLLNEIDADGIEAFKADPHRMATWFAQEKHDGERRGILSTGTGPAVYSNRKGLEVGIQQPIAAAIRVLEVDIGGPFELDAEDMGDHIVIFDVPQHPMLSDRAPFRQRAVVLAHLATWVATQGPAIQAAIKVDVPMPVRQFFAEGLDSSLRQIKAEGFVLKDGEGVYRPGYSDDQLKFKFWESCTARVQGVNGTKRSVALECQDDDGAWVGVGNVTVPANKEIPAKGTLVEIEYLYFRKGGSLFQPFLKGVRTDVGEEACLLSKLKLKAEGARESEPVLEEADGPGF